MKKTMDKLDLDMDLIFACITNDLFLLELNAEYVNIFNAFGIHIHLAY